MLGLGLLRIHSIFISITFCNLVLIINLNLSFLISKMGGK